MDSSPDLYTVRTHRDFRRLLDRLQPGDAAVIERRDLDAASARALLARRPAVVINAADFISGRLANLGPSLLLDAGVVLVEAEPEQARGLRDGARLRLEDATLYDGAAAVLTGRRLTHDQVHAQMDRARAGMSSQLDTFAHTASEFLRREESLLLHGEGLPSLGTELDGSSVVVVGPHATEQQVRRLRRFLREQKPVVIAVDGGADLVRRGRIDVLVLGPGADPGAKALRRAREVVLHDAPEAVVRQVDRLGLPMHRVSTGAAGVDVALLLAEAGRARLVVPVGDPATLEELIDRERSDQASHVLTRLRLGDRLVEASAVPLLYTGVVRRWQLAVVLLAALAVLALTLLATPVGNDWWDELTADPPGWLDWLPGSDR